MNVLEKIKALEAAAPPLTEQVDIEISGVVQKFTFKRIAFLEVRRIDSIPMTIVRTDERDAEGNQKVETHFDVTKVPQRDAEIIAASLVNDDGTQAMTIDQVRGLHPDIGPKFLAAAKRVNGKHDTAIQDATKNSEATGSAGSSTASAANSGSQSPN